jgi:hypothetical protein
MTPEDVSIHTQNHAISAFGVLSEEDRPVAAALLCKTPLTREESCVYAPGGAAKWGLPPETFKDDDGPHRKPPLPELE